MNRVLDRRTMPSVSAQLGSLRWYVAVPLAVVGGLCLYISSPSLSVWPASLAGIILILSAIWQQRLRMGLLLGLLAGAAYWLPLISWLTLYLGAIPWLALSAVMVAWFALFGGLAAFVTRGLSVAPIRACFRVAAQIFSVTGLWVAREQLQSTWPYGGFAWGRVAVTQTDGPFISLVSWLGFAGLSGLVVMLSATVVAIFWARGITLRARVGALGAVAVVSVLLAFVPAASLQSTGTLRVAAVQGNSKSAIFDSRENGDVFRDHLHATEALLDQLDQNNQKVDLIVWPENSAEFQLPTQFYRSEAVKRLSQRADAPIVVGTILQNTDGTYTNSSLVYDKHGDTGLRYDKRRPVPFGEYMPNRDFFHALAPELVDLVQLEYSFGKRPAVLPVQTASGLVQAGIAICFDIAFDDQAIALEGESGDSKAAQVILAQTNNADFGHTDESAQQLEIARLRSVETGRAVVNISTVGTSAVVLPTGQKVQQLMPFTADAIVAEVPLVQGRTPALEYGAIICAFWLFAGASGVAGAFVSLLLRRRESTRRSR